MVAERRDHPGEGVRRQHLGFIHSFWNLLAYEAFRRFVSDGKGILLVKEEDFLNRSLSELNGIEIGYISASVPEGHTLLSHQEIGWMSDYDPESTVLIGFVRSDQGFSSYRIAGLLGRTPKEMYQRLKR